MEEQEEPTHVLDPNLGKHLQEMLEETPYNKFQYLLQLILSSDTRDPLKQRKELLLSPESVEVAADVEKHGGRFNYEMVKMLPIGCRDEYLQNANMLIQP